MDNLLGNEEDSDDENVGALTACSAAIGDLDGGAHSEDAVLVPPATSWAEQMVLDIGLQIEEEEEQAAVRIQAIHRGKLARKKQRLQTKMRAVHLLQRAGVGRPA